VRVLVIGLDGATWDLLMPLADEGFLPTLRKVMDSGSYGELESTIPPVTGPAWASFATGKNPGKTGIFDFLLPKGSLDRLSPVTSGDICGKTFYEIVHDNGGRTVMVNLPLSYPPRTQDPTITSILTQGDQFIFPESLKEDIPELRQYRLTPNFDLNVRGKHDQYTQDIRELEENRFRCARKLFDCEWDFFFVLFSGTDWIQHLLYHRLVSGSLGKDHVALKLYQDIDTYIGWFLEHLPSEAYLLLMSDHGFRVYKGTFNINQWLKENRLAEFCDSWHSNPYPHRFAEGQHKAALRGKLPLPLPLPGPLAQLLRGLGLGRIYRALREYIPVQLQLQTAVDCARTYAFCPTNELSGIYLNSTRRFENGLVEPEDIKRTKAEIISGLERLRDPITGESAFGKVLDSREVYSGKMVEFAPDILILPRDFLATCGLSSKSGFERKIVNGHSISGVFLAYGPDIKKRLKLDPANIYDIAPTILHVFGLPIPKDMDGRVLKDILEEGSEPAQRDVVYADIDDEKQLIRDRIRKLERLGET